MRGRLAAIVAVALGATVPAAGAAGIRPIGPGGALVVDLADTPDGMLALTAGQVDVALMLRRPDGWAACPLPPGVGGDTGPVRLRTDPATGAVWTVVGGRLVRASGACQAWSVVRTSGVADVAVVASPHALVADTRQGVLRSTDEGRTWRRVAPYRPQSTDDANPPLAADGSTVVLRGGPLRCSDDGGRTFRELPGTEDLGPSRTGGGWVWAFDGYGLAVAHGCAAPLRRLPSPEDPGDPPLLGVDAAGRAWFAGETGLHRIDPTSGAATTLPAIDGGAAALAFHAATGEAYVGGFSGVHVLGDGAPRDDSAGLGPGALPFSAAVLGDRVVAAAFGTTLWSAAAPFAGWRLDLTLDGGGIPVVWALDRRTAVVGKFCGFDCSDDDGLITRDGGATWRAYPHLPAWALGSLVSATGSGVRWSFPIDGAGALRSTDAGRSWRATPSPRGFLAGVADPRRRGGIVALFATSRRTCLGHASAGGAWRCVVPRGLPGRVEVVALAAQGTGLVLADPTRVSRSSTGARWRPDDAGLPRPRPTDGDISPSLLVGPDGALWLGRTDGLWRQARPGARWRRVATGAEHLLGSSGRTLLLGGFLSLEALDLPA